MEKEHLKNFLFRIIGDKVPKELIEKKMQEYLSGNSKLEQVGFLFNDLIKLNNNEEEVLSLLSNTFNVDPLEIKKESEVIKRCNIKPFQMPIDENHKLVHSTIKMLCKKLSDANIDYYLVGALPCYLLTGEKDERYHDDIDLMLNEEDIPRVQSLLEDTDFVFADRRKDTPKIGRGDGIPGGEHEVIATHKFSEFHIGFFCFERGLNGEIIHKDYFKDEMGNLKVYKHMITKEMSDLSYDDVEHEYEGVKFKMSSLESTYRIKKYTMNNAGREKDKVDVEMIERSGKLDKDKLSMMDKVTHLPPIIDFVDPDSIGSCPHK